MLKNNLNFYLTSRKISINKLSRDTGISRRSLTQLANNENSGVQYKTIETLLDYFNIELSDLIYNEDSPTKLSFVMLTDDAAEKIISFSNNSKIEHPFVIDLIISKKDDENIYHSFFEINIVTDKQKSLEMIYGFTFNRLDVSGLSKQEVNKTDFSEQITDWKEGHHCFNTDDTLKSLFKVLKKIIDTTRKHHDVTGLTTDPLFLIGCIFSFVLGSALSAAKKDKAYVGYSEFLFMSWLDNPLSNHYNDLFAEELNSSIHNDYKENEHTDTDQGFLSFGAEIARNIDTYAPKSLIFTFSDYETGKAINPRD